MHLYLATGLTPLEGYGGPEADERLELVRLPWREALASVDAGEIGDAKTLIGLYHLARLAATGDLPAS
jgi:ADP-ribose pyrophosphatase